MSWICSGRSSFSWRRAGRRMHALLHATSRLPNHLTATLQPDVIADRSSLNLLHPPCIRFPLQQNVPQANPPRPIDQDVETVPRTSRCEDTSRDRESAQRSVLPLPIPHSDSLKSAADAILLRQVRAEHNSQENNPHALLFSVPSEPSCSRVADGQKRLWDYAHCGTGRIRQPSAHLWTSWCCHPCLAGFILLFSRFLSLKVWGGISGTTQPTPLATTRIQ